jgi:hypothetical protein
MFREPTMIRISVQVYRLFVRLYPRSFRARFGNEMIQCFRDLSRDAFRESGCMGLFGVLMAGVSDHVQSIIREHGESLMRTGNYVKNVLSWSMPACGAVVGALALGLWVATLHDSIGLFSVTRNTSLRFTRGVMEFRFIDSSSFEPPLSRAQFHETALRRGWFVPEEPTHHVVAFSSGHVIGINAAIGRAGEDEDLPVIAPTQYSLLRVPLWALLIPLVLWCGSILKRHGPQLGACRASELRGSRATSATLPTRRGFE